MTVKEQEAAEAAAWLAAQNTAHDHGSYKRGCDQCYQALTLARAADNALRSDGRRLRAVAAAERERLENRIKTASGTEVWTPGENGKRGSWTPGEDGLRWLPKGKCRCQKRCRCSELIRKGFQTPVHQEMFLDEAKAKLSMLP